MSNEYVSVAVRIRPALSFENTNQVTWDPRSFSSLTCLKNDKNFEFDKVYGMNSTTQRIFDEMCESRVWKAMEGFNVSIVCYGQTGSGKTFTMCGKKKAPGIIPLTIQTIFSYIEDTPEKEFLMRCSYCEVYNECINDLLNPLNCNLPLRDDKIVSVTQRGAVIVGLTEEVCRTSEQIFAILKIGDSHKQVSSTSFNQKSSRSHCM